MPTQVVIVFHSVYGHVFKLAQAIEEGAKAAGAEVKLLQVKELLGDDVLAKMHATEAKKAFAHVPLATAADLEAADVIFLGTGTRYGLPSGSLQAFLDSTGSLWGSGKLIGKIGSAFCSTASQHGGQETTLTHLHTFFYHMGMLVSGVPYSAQELLNLTEISGGTPYGATTIAGPKGERSPTANELEIARFQGKHVTKLATR
jgi:NAD(P)H dehydrogenase (quinone)